MYVLGVSVRGYISKGDSVLSPRLLFVNGHAQTAQKMNCKHFIKIGTSSY